MNTERNDLVYGYWREASDKCDYFVTGVAVALVGYVGAAMEVVEIAVSPAGMQAAAAAAFLLSVLSGFKRIEKNIVVFKVMHRRLYSEESAGALAGATMGGGTVLTRSTGEVLTPVEAAEKYFWHHTGAEVTSEMLDELVTSSGRWYKARNIALITGLVVLLFSRVLPAL